MTAEPRTAGTGGRTADAALLIVGSLLGLAGVAVSAAASHAGGGPLVTTAGSFLLIHGVAILALSAWARQMPRPAAARVAAALLAIGVLLFSGDLALAGLFGSRPFPPAAPIGGSLMLAGWAAACLAGFAAMLRRT